MYTVLPGEGMLTDGYCMMIGHVNLKKLREKAASVPLQQPQISYDVTGQK
jgi:hypothetical protein